MTSVVVRRGRFRPTTTHPVVAAPIVQKWTPLSIHCSRVKTTVRFLLHADPLRCIYMYLPPPRRSLTLLPPKNPAGNLINRSVSCVAGQRVAVAFIVANASKTERGKHSWNGKLNPPLISTRPANASPQASLPPRTISLSQPSFLSLFPLPVLSTVIFRPSPPPP